MWSIHIESDKPQKGDVQAQHLEAWEAWTQGAPVGSNTDVGDPPYIRLCPWKLPYASAGIQLKPSLEWRAGLGNFPSWETLAWFPVLAEVWAEKGPFCFSTR
jgi:hypothetical protein